MADDPLSGWAPGAQQSADPLAGWQPAPGWSADADTPPSAPPPPKSILNTSYADAPGAHNNYQGTEWDQDTSGPQRVRQAVSEAYHHGGGGIITPEYRQQIEDQPGWGPFGWLNRNVVLPALGVASAVPAAVGATVGEVFNAAGRPGTKADQITDAVNRAVNPVLPSWLQSPVRPVSDLGRDINFGAPAVLADTAFNKPAASGAPLDTAALRDFMQPIGPPTPSLSDVYRTSRPPSPPDPVTQAMIQRLRQAGISPGMPPPPIPFKGAEPPPPPGGLLNIGATPPPAPQGGLLGPQADTGILSADEIKARSQFQYSPGDKAAAQGANLPQDNANAMRSSLTGLIPDDPERLAYFGKPSLVEAANNAKKFEGQPMSFASAIDLDQDLTRRIRESNYADEQRLLGQAQDSIRDQMDAVPELAGQADARQAWKQYIKQSQVEDLEYRASLLPDDKQSKYIQNQMTSMLRNPSKTRYWTPEEREAGEAIAKSGDIGAIKNFGISLIKPIAQVIGGTAGGYVGGPVGGIIGSNVGGELGAAQQARIREYLSRTSLDPLKRQISQGVPPIPPVPQGP